MKDTTVYLATRGSALALAQTNMVIEQCRRLFPELRFEAKIIKTTGDKLQTASLASANLPKGLFTKELETALLAGEADLAVHSLKDLPTELPDGLELGAVSERADVRDVLVYRDAHFLANPPDYSWAGQADSTPKRGFTPGLTVKDLPRRATVATSSTRRSAQLLEKRPDLNIVPVRGNVGTRLNKLAAQPELDAIVLAAAGLERLRFTFNGGVLRGESVPNGLLVTPISPDEMLPCVGQAALGIEIKSANPIAHEICSKLNHPLTMTCVRAERAFLRGMGGGCQVPVGAYAAIAEGQLKMSVISFLGSRPARASAHGEISDPESLGLQLAQKVKS
jgi:hydroxymethylbilane synthase